jgi:hypothetical protein
VSLAEATDAAKKLLLLMDTDKSGKVSKQEWMRFMEAEFDSLDTNHDGQLDVKELTQSQMRVQSFVASSCDLAVPDSSFLLSFAEESARRSSVGTSCFRLPGSVVS